MHLSALFAELRNYARKCLYMKLLPRDVSKGICGLRELRLQHEAAGAAGRALLCKLLFSTRLTIFLEKFKLQCNHGGHYSGNGRKPVLSRGIFFFSWIAETLRKALDTTSLHGL